MQMEIKIPPLRGIFLYDGWCFKRKEYYSFRKGDGLGRLLFSLYANISKVKSCFDTPPHRRRFHIPYKSLSPAVV